MKARIKWVEDRTFVGETGSGHKIVFGTASGPDGIKPKPGPEPDGAGADRRRRLFGL